MPILEEDVIDVEYEIRDYVTDQFEVYWNNLENHYQFGWTLPNRIESKYKITAEAQVYE